MWLDSIERIAAIIGVLGGSAGVVGWFYARRERKADVRSKEISTADQMVDLVKKTYDEVFATYKTEREEDQQQREEERRERDKLRRCISRLERAVKAINSCPHTNECPVTTKLQEDNNDK